MSVATPLFHTAPSYIHSAFEYDSGSILPGLEVRLLDDTEQRLVVGVDHQRSARRRHRLHDAEDVVVFVDPEPGMWG